MATQIVTVLTLIEVADRLRKSPAQLRWMIHSGPAPKSALIGSRRMFRESDLEDYINQAFDAARPDAHDRSKYHGDNANRN